MECVPATNSPSTLFWLESATDDSSKPSPTRRKTGSGMGIGTLEDPGECQSPRYLIFFLPDSTWLLGRPSMRSCGSCPRNTGHSQMPRPMPNPGDPPTNGETHSRTNASRDDEQVTNTQLGARCSSVAAEADWSVLLRLHNSCFILHTSCSDLCRGWPNVDGPV